MFELYDPCIFVRGNEGSRSSGKNATLYCNCLTEVYKARNMNDDAKKELLRRFDIKDALKCIASDKEASARLQDFFKKHASRPVLTGFFTDYCTALIAADAAANAEPVLSTLVNLGSSDPELTIARQAISDPAVLGAEGLDAATLLSRWVAPRLSLPYAPRFCALDIAATLVAKGSGSSNGINSRKALKRALRQVVATALDNCTGPGDITAIEHVFTLIGAAASPLTGEVGQSNSSGKDGIAASGFRSIGKVIIPRLATIGITPNDVSQRLMVRIPLEAKRNIWKGWKRGSVDKFVRSLREPHSPLQLRQSIARCVCIDLAAAMDWDSYLTHLEAAATSTNNSSGDSRKESVSTQALSVIRLCATAFVAPDSIHLGRDIAAKAVNWRALVRPGDFAAAFDGSFFTGLVDNFSGGGNDETILQNLSFAEALRWLASVAENIGTGNVATGVAQEALAVSFMVVAREGLPQTEYKPLLAAAEVDRILLDVQLGLCQYLAGGCHSGDDDVDKNDALDAVVKCVFTYCAPTPQVVHIVQFSGSIPAATEDGKEAKSDNDSDSEDEKSKILTERDKQKKHDGPAMPITSQVMEELRRRAAEKDIGLVLQFPKQSVPGVALRFVSLAGPAFGSDLRLCVTVLEEAIRAYFTLTEAAATGVAQVARALVPPDNVRDFFAACVEAHAALTAYTLVEQLCAFGREQEAVELVSRSISRFTPHQTYQADIVALWFSALSLAEDSEWTPARQEDLAPLRQIARYLREFGAPGGVAAGLRKRKEGEAFEDAQKRLFLAARAAHIFYMRLTLDKSRVIASNVDITDSAFESSLIGFKNDEEELAAAIQQLRKAGDAKENKKYKAFFALITSFRNADYTAKKFKHDIAETLFPMEPYLKNI